MRETIPAARPFEMSRGLVGRPRGAGWMMDGEHSDADALSR